MPATPLPLALGGFDPLQSAGPALVWTVVLVFVFLECAVIIGLFLPGDSMLLTAGIIFASHETGHTQVWALVVATMVAAIAGNQVGYVIGTRTGHRLIARKNGKYVNAENLARVSDLLHRHGFAAVLIARWIPWVRTLCPLVAGAAGMNHRRYTVASSIGAVIWAPILLLLGYYTGGYLNKVSWLMPAVSGSLVVVLIIGTIIGLRQYRAEMSRPAEDFDVELESDGHTFDSPGFDRQAFDSEALDTLPLEIRTADYPDTVPLRTVRPERTAAAGPARIVWTDPRH
ncbi:SNARE associated Golgi protein [Nocardia africana]|uniref:SNARE associated Golgi protein n=1 Tax=Nocardia africana TaxID=134964 RepID=A0A378X4F9_9NOCA|nr:SNARE associated Golgi protein [Nocardia africana]